MRLPPLLSLLTAAKREIMRRSAIVAQWGQETGLSAWLIGRSVSKGAAQLAQ
jgi:hypothetical protein